MDEEAGQVARRRPVKRLAALVLLGLVLVVLLALWLQRKPIAADFIDRELARRGVQASYTVKRIGLRTQRLERLVIGDPAHPDLTARWVEIRVSWGFRRPKVSLITARGVRLYGRLVNGRVSFGQVDRLLPPPSGLPFRFPDQVVDVADAAVRLDTPAGRIGLGVEGKGNLAGGFRGKLAAVSPGLRLGSCAIDAPRGFWTVTIDDLRPTLAGPMSATRLACGDRVALTRPQLGLQATLAQALDHWRGNASVRSAAALFGGNRAASLAGQVGFDGDSGMTRGSVDLGALGLRIVGLSAIRAVIDGDYALSLNTGRLSLRADARGRAMAGGPTTLRPLIAALASAGGTPFEPIGDSISGSLARALRGFDAAGALRLVNGPGYGGVRFERLGATSRSGARLAVDGGEGVTYYWPSGLTRIDGEVALAGGGFPSVRLSLDQPGAGRPIRGVGRIAPLAAGGARLALGEIRFTAAPGGTTSLGTVATLDGPLGDGRIEGLVVPIAGRIDGRGGFVFGERCTPARFRLLRTGSLRLGPTALPLCPTGRALVWKAPGGSVQGGAELRRPRFAGTIGSSPVEMTSSRLRFALGGPAFAASDVAVRLGRAGSVSRLAIASLAGRFAGPGVSGRYSGMSGKLANVPLLLDQGNGGWRLANGKLAVEGGLRVADEVSPARFYPLVARDFRLTLADNAIRASAWLDDPETGTRITRADIEHRLDTGRGRARLDVPGIRFGPDYQPEQLTRLTTGVIALVNGVVKGEGEIVWNSSGSSSTGTFSTDDMGFAATFGPVEHLKSEVHFTDLLGLVSAPGQLAEIGLIRTGIDVLDGRIRYQLLPDLHVRVEGGRWPFAGGELLLDETVLDFSKPSEKRLTFRVVGLDAARFVQLMEFSNISATGTFDGVVPMVFDERGGRIVGGRLVARSPGGTLSYIGELTDKQLGVYGKLAFDALKSLRYDRLIINLDGSLDGEFFAGIQLDGIARDPSVAAVAPGSGIRGRIAGRALTQLAKIPFHFNINVRGPFRALIATTRSLSDPTNLLQSVLPQMLRDKPTETTTTVQPQESETVP